MDFTLKTYRTLLDALLMQGFSFQAFRDFIREPRERVIILRHDVDRRPGNSLAFARIQHALGIRGTYYFRAVAESWNERIIREIHGLGHEIGYHYETMETAFAKSKIKNQKSKIKAVRRELPTADCLLPTDLIDLAWAEFCETLERFRIVVPVETICMHGSPGSKYDNRDLWKKHDYRPLGIIGEPYLDVDFGEVLYLTDTGRRWNGWKSSVRDKIPQQDEWIRKGLVFRSTNDIIRACKNGKLPDRIMMTFHPQRWHDDPLRWTKELVLQNVKNQMKRLLFVTRDT